MLKVRVEIRDLDYVMIDPRHGSEELSVPEFSSDDGAADGLAALLTFRGYDLLSEEFPLKGWQVILKPPGDAPHVEEYAATFALALCYAALAVVGVTPIDD